MKIAQRKLDFLVLYVVISLTAMGVVRKALVLLAEWMRQLPGTVASPENY